MDASSKKIERILTGALKFSLEELATFLDGARAKKEELPKRAHDGDFCRYRHRNLPFEYTLTTLGPFAQSGMELVNFRSAGAYHSIWHSGYRWELPRIPNNIRVRGQEIGFIRESFDF